MISRSLGAAEAVLAAGLALVAAGCSGSCGKPLSKQGYSSKLNQIRTDYNAHVKAIGEPRISSEAPEPGHVVDEQQELSAEADMV